MKHVLITSILICSIICFVTGCGNDENSTLIDDGTLDIERAEEALVHRDLRSAVVAFGEAARKNETNFNVRIKLSLINLHLGDLNAAEQSLTQALQICPESAEAHLVDAQLAYLKRDYQRANTAYEKVIAETSLPANLRSDAYVGRGVVAMAQNAIDVARLDFLRAIRAYYKNGAAWYHLGVIARDYLKYNEVALEDFQLASRFMDARELRTQKICHTIIPALRDIQTKNLVKSTGNVKRDTMLAKKLLVEVDNYAKKKMAKKAIGKCEDALVADPRSEEAALKLIELVTRNDKTSSGVDKVLGAYRRLIEIRPQRQEYYQKAASWALKNKRWATAESILDRAVAHDPQNIASMKLYLIALEKSGKSASYKLWFNYLAEINRKK